MEFEVYRTPSFGWFLFSTSATDLALEYDFSKWLFGFSVKRNYISVYVLCFRLYFVWI